MFTQIGEYVPNVHATRMCLPAAWPDLIPAMKNHARKGEATVFVL
jgi:hypothetical protein